MVRSIFLTPLSRCRAQLDGIELSTDGGKATARGAKNLIARNGLDTGSGQSTEVEAEASDAFEREFEAAAEAMRVRVRFPVLEWEVSRNDAHAVAAPAPAIFAPPSSVNTTIATWLVWRLSALQARAVCCAGSWSRLADGAR
eukprot:3798838-Prymnesium_polylepis.1